jgi:hypothetical protein
MTTTTTSTTSEKRSLEEIEDNGEGTEQERKKPRSARDSDEIMADLAKYIESNNIAGKRE